MLPKLFFFSLFYSLIFTHSYSQCLDHQKSLLLQLKNELIFNSSLSTKLVQWNQTDHDCCKWFGVECNGAGYVISLQLVGEAISGGIGDSSSLFRLEYLEKLNLAYNDFNYTRIPKGIGNLTYLTHLDLKYATFSGQVPVEISSLRRLVSLDISDVYWIVEPLKLEYPIMEKFVQNLTRLEELYLDAALISSQKCLELFANFSSLTTLSLGNCDLSGSFPINIFQMPSLQNLDLLRNEQLGGSIPPFNQNGSFKSIVLSWTNFSGSIPSSISNLKTLSVIDLSNCQFTGSIPSTFTNLTHLTHVDLADNLLTPGSLSSTLFGGLSSLVYLDLSGCRLQGAIPASFFQLDTLESLLLSRNSFNGTFQLTKIQSLANLTVLDLSENNLSVDTNNVNSSKYGLPRLKELHLRSCNLSAFPDFLSYSDMRVLDLSNNGIAGEIPNWIWGTQLHKLDLCCNLLTHLQKPYRIPASLAFLTLSYNQFRGELPILHNVENQTSVLIYISLANNKFSGSIPTSLCTIPYLQILELSINNLSGTIPPCLLENHYLNMVDLSRNNITGHIPDKLSLYCGLEIINLRNNNLSGKIPKSLQNCKWLAYLNVGNNIINDTFPCMLPSSLRALILRSNRFHGEVRCQKIWPDLQVVDISSNNFSGSLESINFSSWRAMVLGSDAQLRHNNSGYYSLMVGLTLFMKGIGVQLGRIWPEFVLIDLSYNNFEGEIPNAIGDLTSLHILNFSHNALKGNIPKSFRQLRMLESLDLSTNQLTGAIPMELAELTFLQVLNLSYNELVGKIPNGRQLQTFTADSFIGNPGLCGFNLNISCTSNTDGDTDPPHHENEEEKEIEWEYVSAALGYVVGLGSIVWLLLFCQSFRQKYFGKIDEVVEETFDARDRRRRLARREVRIRNRLRRQ